MKEIKLEEDAISTQLKGINTAVDLVKISMGARGRLVNIDHAGGIHSTYDGFTILAHTAMKDKCEDMGVKIVLEAASKQVKDCGDGTTSVSVLLQAIINEGVKMLKYDADRIKVIEGINLASKEAIKIIKELAKPVSRDSHEIEQIAKVSAHGDEDIAKLIAEAISITNHNSIIRVEESKGNTSYVDLAKGMKVGSGWLSGLFVNNGSKGTVEYDNPLILVYEGKIERMAQLQNLLEKCVNAKKPIVIVSDDMDGEVLASLALNAKKGLPFAAINPFGETREDRKERLADLAAYVGGELISPDLGHKLENIDLNQLGTCDRVIIAKNNSIFQDGAGLDTEILNERISNLESLVKITDHTVTKTFYEARLAALNGGVATIYVGGIVSTDVVERKDRIDDAVGSALSALEEGVVPGGGVSLLHISEELRKLSSDDSDVNIGISIFKKAVTMPIRQILTNAGESVDFIIDKIKNKKSKSYGYNVHTKEYVDMIKEGILDPAKVEIKIIENATITATNFLNTGGLIAVVPENN